MSTTLTNGLKLPDKGSVDWYADMQNNYNILDGAVGTIAEHTSALAGKAPLVHTHSKADITDFPAYGNTAGTICEGNDSRLSDARTPVAHTHTKSDVTDLFNSANTWTETNTFLNYITSKESAAISAGGYGKGIAFRDYQDNRLGYIQPSLTSDSEKRLLIGADSGDVASNSNLIPNTNNSYNLGSSSYQWNNLYAKNYFYNGTAWGLDKANVWSAENTFTSANINIQRPFTLGNNTYQIARLQILDSAPTPQRLGTFNFVHHDNNLSRLEIGIYGLNSNNEIKNRFLLFQLNPDETSSFFPLNKSQINLGTSTNKWKTLNGINPGALSLPSTTSDSFSGDITDKSGNNASQKTWTVNGWGYIFIPNVSGDFISVVASNATETYLITGTGTGNPNIGVSFPIVAGRTYSIFVKTSNAVTANYFTCLGNV